MECYIINLDRSIDNFYKQRPYLMESGIFPVRFSGIDAKYDKHLQYVDDHVNSLCKDFCTNGLIGCGLSHILLAKKLFEKGSNLVLILEDDAYPTVNDLNKEIKKVISETPIDWDIIKLHCDFCDNDTYKINTIGGSAAAYLINKSGLEKLSNMKLKTHLDLQFNIEPNLHVYKSKKNIFWADETQSENRDFNINTTFLDYFNFNKTGQKKTDYVLSCKTFKIFGYELAIIHLIYLITCCFLLIYIWRI